MKIKVEQAELARILAIVGPSVAKLSRLPIITGVLVKASDAGVTVQGTNLETAIEIQMDCQVEEAGACVLPFKLLSEFVSNLPKEIISIEGDDQKGKLVCGGYKGNMQGFEASDFPQLPIAADGDEWVTVDAKDFGRAVSQTAACAADENNRPYLKAVCIRGTKGGGLWIVGADGFRIAARQLGPAGPVAWECIVPKDAVPSLLAVLPPGEAVRLVVRRQTSESVDSPIGDVTALLVVTEKSKFVARVIDFKYPDWMQMVPREATTSVTCETQVLRKAIDAVRPFLPENTSPIAFRFSEGLIMVQGKGVDIGDSEVPVQATVVGPLPHLYFNAKQLAEVVATVDTETVTFGATERKKPVLVNPVGDESHVIVMMPVYMPGED